MLENFETLLETARRNFASGLHREVGEALGKILDADPKHKAAICLLAESMYQLGQSDLALSLLSDVVREGDMDVAILKRISVILGTLGRREEEADFLMFAAEADPSDGGLVREACAALSALGRDADVEALRSLAGPG
jgi:thioredoxin-like negative regulator of GroEL